MSVTAALVTRGNVPMDKLLASIPEDWEVAIWDNSTEASDLGVYGRYAAIERARTGIVFVQDDDCVLPEESFAALMDAYEPGRIVANMPLPFREHYTDSCLLGFGAIFDKDLPLIAFSKLQSRPPDFGRTCDVYFTALTPEQTWLDLPYKNMRWAIAKDRMYRQVDHVGSRAKALEHARRLR